MITLTSDKIKRLSLYIDFLFLFNLMAITIGYLGVAAYMKCLVNLHYLQV